MMASDGPWSIPHYMQRLWFIHATTENPRLLNIGVDLEIVGVHEPEEIRRAFEGAVRRHDAFALRFTLSDCGPTCDQIAYGKAIWKVVDISTDESVAAEDGRAGGASQAHDPAFNLKTGPLVGGTLFVLGKNKSMLSVTAHQLIADARTLRILVEDFLTEWRRIRGEPIDVERPGLAFSDVLRAATHCQDSEVSSLAPTDVVRQHDSRYGSSHIMRPATGSGDECAFRLGEDLASQLRRVCGHAGVTPFTALLAGLGTLIEEIGLSPRSDVGVLFTNRDLRRYGRTAGCFVQMLPVDIECPASAAVVDVLHRTARNLRELRAILARGRSAQRLSNCPVMVSMVRDSRAVLCPPSGINVRPRRRRRVQAETSLHVFLHDLGRDVEIVMNYDTEMWLAEEVAKWAGRYLEVLRAVASSGPSATLTLAAGEGASLGRFRQESTICYLHHIGLAVWELDISLRRLAAVNIHQHGDIVTDQDAGVALALAGPVEGVELELVAPLREDAPCVGALMRAGEGSYHCCWRVTDANLLQTQLTRCGVEASVVSGDANTLLLSGCQVSFALVNGLGLVEWLTSGEKPVRSTSGPRTTPLRIDVESNDVPNAERFLAAIGYYPVYDEAIADSFCWFSSDRGHAFTLKPCQSGAGNIARITRVNIGSCLSGLAFTDAPMVSRWWSRVRLGSAQATIERERNP